MDRHEVSLRDIGDILGFGVFREEMTERLILARPGLIGDRLPPCLGIREDRVHVVDDPPEGKFAVFDHLTYGELRGTGFHKFHNMNHRQNRQRPTGTASEKGNLDYGG